MMSSLNEKLEIAEKKKREGDLAYCVPDNLTALRFYHEALFYLKGLDSKATDAEAGNSGNPPAETKEINEALEKVYSNMSACLIKMGKWDRAIETADQALAKNSNNEKAKLRRGKALGEKGQLGQAIEILEDLLKSATDYVSEIKAELEKFRRKEKAATKAAETKFRGFLNPAHKLHNGEASSQGTPDLTATS